LEQLQGNTECRGLDMKSQEQIPVRSAAPGGRLHYIDNLRIFALCLGIFVHSTNFVPADEKLALIELVSSNFRMATFFLVSGLFAAMVATTRGYSEYYKRRILALGVPLVVGITVLNAINIPLKQAYQAYVSVHAGAEISQTDNPALLHLWFLIALIIFVALTPLIINCLRWKPVAAAAAFLSSRRWAALTCLGLTAGFTCYAVLVRWAASQLGMEFLARSTAHYLPLFAMGCLLFMHRQTASIFYRVDLPAIAFAAALAVLGQLLPDESLLQKVCHDGSKAAFQCCATFALLWVFRRFASFSNGATRTLSRSVYTMYILHYLLLTLAATLWVRILPSGPAQALVMPFIAGGLGLLIHMKVVERVPLFAFLLNGKLPDGRARQDVRPDATLRT
jgi:peptidoglycan/LPS O-acetylase OafA/YrhL